VGENGARLEAAADPLPVPVFFLSDSTGITAETMGNALLIQFPSLRFERRLTRSSPPSKRPAGW
jgi:hypothetical protein